MTCKKLKKDFTCRDHKGTRCIDVPLDKCRYKPNIKKVKTEPVKEGKEVAKK